ncbi:MAG: NADH-quinone oxidoreductase subunit L, partial [Bacteroidota bacterium]
MPPVIHILPILIPLAGAILVPVAALAGRWARNTMVAAAGLLTAAAALALLGMLRTGAAYSIRWSPAVPDFAVGADAVSVFLAAIAGVLGFFILVYSLQYMKDHAESAQTRYYALVLLFIGGMIGLVLTTNLLVLYFFWELAGLCSYALIGFDYRHPGAAAAGVKAFLTTRIGDVGLFAGIMTLYYGTSPHTFALPEIAAAVARGAVDPALLAFAAFAMLLGAVGKSAQVPLHVWLPDAMEAPTPISALIHAATMVNAGVYLMIRVHPLFAGVPHWSGALMAIGALTAFLAAGAAVVQHDLKRLLAYSTVSQLGFMMFAVGTGGLVAAQFHLMSHAVFKAVLFLSAGTAIHLAGTRDMRAMGGLAKQTKLTAASFLVGACALAGVPIFNGFWSKDMIFGAALAAGQIVPLIFMIGVAGLTVVYAFRAYRLVFLGVPRSAELSHGAHGLHGGAAPAGLTVPVGILALGTLGSWLTVGLFTTDLATTGFPAEPLSVGELIRETLRPGPVLAASLAALVLGALGLRLLPRASKYGLRLAPLVQFARSGFGFDDLYRRVSGTLMRAGRATFGRYDEQVVDALEGGVAAIFRGLSGALRRGHTGDLSL